MTYRVELVPSAHKSLAKFHPIDRERILRALISLESDPRPRAAAKLKGQHDTYRLRVGDYRILYEVRDDVLRVLVVRLAHRREAYRG